MIEHINSMTATEFVNHLAPVEMKRLALIFASLADRMHSFRLADGQRLNDVTDVCALLRELSAALEFRDSSNGALVPPPQARWKTTCPDCHHEHEGRTDCSKYLGEEKFCRCETKVTA